MSSSFTHEAMIVYLVSLQIGQNLRPFTILDTGIMGTFSLSGCPFRRPHISI